MGLSIQGFYVQCHILCRGPIYRGPMYRGPIYKGPIQRGLYIVAYIQGPLYRASIYRASIYRGIRNAPYTSSGKVGRCFGWTEEICWMGQGIPFKGRRRPCIGFVYVGTLYMMPVYVCINIGRYVQGPFIQGHIQRLFIQATYRGLVFKAST